jgi:hypothetical protein
MSICIEIETDIFDNNMHTYVLQFCPQSLLVKKSKFELRVELSPRSPGSNGKVQALFVTRA